MKRRRARLPITRAGGTLKRCQTKTLRLTGARPLHAGARKERGGAPRQTFFGADESRLYRSRRRDAHESEGCLTTEYAIHARHSALSPRGRVSAARRALRATSCDAAKSLDRRRGCTNLSVAARSDHKVARGKHKGRFGNLPRLPKQTASRLNSYGRPPMIKRTLLALTLCAASALCEP